MGCLTTPDDLRRELRALAARVGQDMQELRDYVRQPGPPGEPGAPGAPGVGLQEVFANSNAAPNYPALNLKQVTISGQQVYKLQGSIP